METLRRHDLSRRTLALLVFLVAVATSIMMVPQKAWAACCGRETDTTYYSDASKTVEVGYCDTNVGCSGTNDCPGPTTPYYTRTTFCCELCTP